MGPFEHRRRRAVTAAMVVVAALAGTAPAAGAAPAGTPPAATRSVGPSGELVVQLPFSHAGKLAVEPGTGRIFAAGDDRVAVLTPGGASVATLDAMYGATEVVAGGGSIWVLLSSTSTIARINPSTLAVTTFSAGDRGPLTGLAYAGGKAWVMGAPPDTFGGNLLGLDPGTGTWVVTETDFYDFGLLVSSPQTPNTVVGAETGISAHRLTRWEVSSGTAVKVVSQSEDGFIRDLAISPDGTKLLTTSGSPYHLVERNLSTLAGSGTSYPMAAYPSGVATTTARGGFIAAQANAYYDAVDTWVYRPGAPAAVKKARMAGTPGGGEDPAEGAIDLTADASAVVSISWDSYQDFANPGTVPAYLHILTFVPRISGVTPSILGTRGGGSVNIPGQNLGGVTAVKIGGVHAPMTTKSASSITVTAPALPAGLATVTATEGDTTVSSPLPVRVTALGPFRLGTMFLERQYRDTLGRSPSFAELSTWTGRLATGTAPGALPAGLVTTPTLTRYRSPIIRMLHASNIAFSTASVANWSAKYKAGTSLKAIGDHYAVARYGSMPTRNFVDQIHRNVLGRPATLAELSDWSTRLKTMTRGQMIVAFSESSANITRTTNQVRVTELYIAMLRRVPTLAEAKTSASTTDVATTLLTSTPYASRYPSG